MSGGIISKICARSFSRLAGVLPVLALLVATMLTATAATAQDPADYRISVGDALQLDFLDDSEEAFPLTVGGRGNVQLPYLGSFAVAGQTLDQARLAMIAQYAERQILVEPQLDLSIVNLRPFSVIGEVQSPGFFDYRENITIEQAVGLAGGPRQDPGGEEARSLQRVALQGEMVANDSRILRAAVTAARLRAQLAGSDRIAPGDVDVPAVSTPDAALIASLVVQENAIIAAERVHHGEDQALVEGAIEEASKQIDLIIQQISAQTAQIESYDAELASNETLSDRGLVAAPVRAQLLRRVADEQTALLRLETTLAATRRDRAGLERELLSIKFRRTQDWREALANAEVEIAQLRATQDSVLDRIALVEDWSRRTADADRGLRVSFVVRRRTPEGEHETITVTETDTVQPGDVIIVKLQRTETTLSESRGDPLAQDVLIR
ncbi:polysaccharide biosynthesis/export family protein [Paracoccus jeotgali]|uniref:Uncharacterized protein n=1 Tax=Paracoccus jeotgali TaxID=2065379 RepID=A0A2K9MIA8_9RHOB|nr:polysaccharide biosynthesis/export family protein [Paracoccus jeotgali]AUM74275.1 hypothetical protein CYR75_08315 [Paracoccus jeotgali]